MHHTRRPMGQYASRLQFGKDRSGSETFLCPQEYCKIPLSCWTISLLRKRIKDCAAMAARYLPSRYRARMMIGRPSSFTSTQNRKPRGSFSKLSFLANLVSNVCWQTFPSTIVKIKPLKHSLCPVQTPDVSAALSLPLPSFKSLCRLGPRPNTSRSALSAGK